MSRKPSPASSPLSLRINIITPHPKDISNHSDPLLHFVNPEVHLLDNLLAVGKNLLFPLQFLPGQPIHTLDAGPGALHLLLELLNARVHLPEDGVGLALNIFLEKFHLVPELSDVGLQLLRIETGLFVDILIWSSKYLEEGHSHVEF